MYEIELIFNPSLRLKSYASNSIEKQSMGASSSLVLLLPMPSLKMVSWWSRGQKRWVWKRIYERVESKSVRGDIRINSIQQWQAPFCFVLHAIELASPIAMMTMRLIWTIGRIGCQENIHIGKNESVIRFSSDCQALSYASLYIFHIQDSSR